MTKTDGKTKTNTILRAKIVYDIAMSYYKPGRQDRCLLWVYRDKVSKIYPISVATFWRYLRIAESKYGEISDKK